MQNINRRNGLDAGESAYGNSHPVHSAIMSEKDGYLAGFPPFATMTGEVLMFDANHFLHAGSGNGAVLVALNGAAGGGGTGGGLSSSNTIDHTEAPAVEV